ncbi:hypothetical protein [Synechococcus sp. KORDI-52]|uniref:hypothetical protein n=1 Tax=Synechococcus sp. KORDI-52 TaxID=585425 RepID=UPI0012EB88FA|nr:hypothetical protein [Synechococcus sp. KORDI-52]
MSTEKKTKGNEVLIAIIGLTGVLTPAGLSSWDKIYPKSNVIKAEYLGYRPTGNFETELRHYFNVSGARQAHDNTQKHLVQNFKMRPISQYPN